MRRNFRSRSGAAGFLTTLTRQLIMGAAVVGAVGVLGYMFFNNLNKQVIEARAERDAARMSLNEALGRERVAQGQLEAAQEDRRRRELSLALTRVTHRLARIDILGER